MKKIEGWRVTTTDGTVIPVNVRTQDGDYWASIPGCVGACKPSPLIAVACATSPMLDVAEILAPGVATRDEALAEVERMREIHEGRTTPPTDAEIDAHAAAGGSWVVGVRPVHTAREAREMRDVCERRAVLHEETPPGWPPYRWLAFDAEGRACAWPVVGGAR